MLLCCTNAHNLSIKIVKRTIFNSFLSQTLTFPNFTIPHTSNFFSDKSCSKKLLTRNISLKHLFPLIRFKNSKFKLGGSLIVLIPLQDCFTTQLQLLSNSFLVQLRSMDKDAVSCHSPEALCCHSNRCCCHDDKCCYGN